MNKTKEEINSGQEVVRLREKLRELEKYISSPIVTMFCLNYHPIIQDIRSIIEEALRPKDTYR